MVETIRFGSEIPDTENRPKTVALGIGGAGRNILSSMKGDPSLSNMKMFEVGSTERLPDLPFIGIKKPDMLQTYDSDIPIGNRPMNESEEKLMRRLRGNDIIYMLAGMGGETGTWTTYACSQIAKRTGTLSLALIALPFKTESQSRHQIAEAGKRKLARYTDIVGSFSNSKLMKINPYISMTKAFDVMNRIIRLPVEDFNTVITREDIKYIKEFCDEVDEFKIGAGYGKGRERGKRASREAYRSPWLDESERFKTILAVVTSGHGRGEMEAQDALEVIRERSPKAKIMWGLKKNIEIGERTKVTLLAGV